MKKIISMLLVLSMLLFVAIVPASADKVKGALYEDRFFEEYSNRYGASSPFYQELYYHHTDANDLESPVDWAFVHCCVALYDVDGWGGKYVIKCDRVIGETFALGLPFDLPYAIYDVEKDKFIYIGEVNEDDYEGLEECLSELELGVIIGDIDNDRTLSVIDASIIQKCIAKLDDFSNYYDVCEKFGYNGETEKLAYYSDVDRDGERTVMDATAIQLRLAKLA